LYKGVNQVAFKGPTTQTKWSHIPITLSADDISLTSHPHTDAMVITAHIDIWDVSRINIDNNIQAEVLFLPTFEKKGYDKNLLKEPLEPLYGFNGARIKPVGVITLPISFVTPKNPRTEDIVFDVVDMPYPYNAIFEQGLLNIFEAALHSAYLCLKIPATFGVITIFASQKEA
jgi:hypothetical protein